MCTIASALGRTGMVVNDNEVVTLPNVVGELANVEAIMDVERELLGTVDLAHGSDGIVVWK